MFGGRGESHFIGLEMGGFRGYKFIKEMAGAIIWLGFVFISY